jgi:hypothetical protein
MSIPPGDAMGLSYLSGQRPADVLKMSRHDIRNDELHVRQNKTRHALRIRIKIDDVPTELGMCVERLQARLVQSMSGELISTEGDQPLTMKMLRGRFDAARAAAAEQATNPGNAELTKRTRAFQFPTSGRRQQATSPVHSGGREQAARAH